jgi:hypothetical protein
MHIINVRYCLSMARSLDAEAARTRDDSYLRKLLLEQSAKYRADAESTDTSPTRPICSPRGRLVAATQQRPGGAR